MIELERHIEVLLLSNDCVIVPDFGGFVAHHVDARYDHADSSFIPPIRTLGFNPQLKINDSVLIHSYIDAYGLSYPEAAKRVEQDVSELRDELGEQGFYELNNIGTLSLNDDGNIEFTPNEAGILTPDYYGLSAFPIQKLEHETVLQQQQFHAGPATATHVQAISGPQEDKQEEPSILAIDESDDDQTISIRVAWIRNAVAIAAAVLAFFMITTPVSNSVVTPQMTMSSIKPSLIADTTKPAPMPANVPVQADTVRQAPPQPAEVLPKQEETLSQPEKQSYYVVVLASQVSMSNADSYVKQLHKRGYKEAHVLTLRKINRVVYGKYDKESDAYTAAGKLRQNEEFGEAWVMRVNS